MSTLPEQWIILTLDKKSGKTKIPRSVFQCGITAGMLLELALINRIGLSQEKKLQVLDDSPMEDPLLNKALGLIVKSKKQQTVLNWILQLTMQNSRVIESLFFKQMTQQNILKKKPYKVMGIFTSKRYCPVSEEIRIETLGSLAEITQTKALKETRPLCLLGLVSRSGYADRILGIENATFLSKNSISIFSNLEHKHFSSGFIPFLQSVLEALTLSQQSAGSY